MAVPLTKHMKKVPVLTGLLCSAFALGTVIELLSAQTPDFVDAWINLLTGVVLLSTVIINAARAPSFKATMGTAAMSGAALAVGLTLGLWLPYALSIGDRDVGEWLPGEYNILLIVLWDGMLGGVIGLVLGFVAVFFNRNVPARPASPTPPRPPSSHSPKAG